MEENKLEISIDSQDVIRLMLQFLKENNLHSSLFQLQKETGIYLNTVDNLDSFLGDIKNGRWDSVLNQIASLKLPIDKLADLYEQMLFELLEVGERDIAKEILRSAEPLIELKSSNKDRYLKLDTLCKKPYFNANEAYELGTTKDSRRNEIANSLAFEVSSVEPARLLSLLGQSLKYQHSQGFINPGIPFDLFRSTRKTSKRDLEEKIARRDEGIMLTNEEKLSQISIFSPDGQNFTTCREDGILKICETETFCVRQDLDYQKKSQYLDQGSTILCGQYSKDGDHFALGSDNGQIKIWKISSGACLRTFLNAHAAGITHLAFSRDGTQLLSSSFDKTARIHGLKSGKTLKEFRGHASFVNCAIYAKDNTGNVVTSSSDGSIKFWDFRTTDCLLTISPGLNLSRTLTEVPINSIYNVANTVDQIVVCTKSPYAYIINGIGQTVRTFYSGKANGGDFLCAAVSPQGKYFYAAAEDGILYVFNIKDGLLEEVVPLNMDSDIIQISHHPNRNMLFVLSKKGSLRLIKA